MLVVKYESKNFFGDVEYREDKKQYPTLADIKKAFQFLKKSYNHTIEIDNTVLYWDTMTDFEYGTLTAKEFDTNNYNSWHEFIWDYDGCKKNYYKIYANT